MNRWRRATVLAACSFALVSLALPVKAQVGVDEYFLGVDPDSLQYIYDNWWLDYYVPCTIAFEGDIWPDCRVRIRGDTSRTYPKKSLKVKSDGLPFPNGTNVMNINADWRDPSYIRTVMSTRVFKESGHPCFNASHVRLYLNGEFWGLYVQVENMDEDFLTARGMDPTGNLYKATNDGACLSIFDDIYVHWEKKTNELGPWDDLQTFIDSLNTVPDMEYKAFCERTMDYDLMLNVIALNALTSNGSTYYHNYYMYHDIGGSGLWTMLPWDLDKTFAQYGMYAYHRTSKHSLPDNPFAERAFIVDEIFDDFSLRVDEIVAATFNPDFLFPIVDSLVLEIEASVAADTTDNRNLPHPAGHTSAGYLLLRGQRHRLLPLVLGALRLRFLQHLHGGSGHDPTRRHRQRHGALLIRIPLLHRRQSHRRSRREADRHVQRGDLTGRRRRPGRPR